MADNLGNFAIRVMVLWFRVLCFIDLFCYKTFRERYFNRLTTTLSVYAETLESNGIALSMPAVFSCSCPSGILITKIIEAALIFWQRWLASLPGEAGVASRPLTIFMVKVDFSECKASMAFDTAERLIAVTGNASKPHTSCSTPVFRMHLPVFFSKSFLQNS